VQKIMFADGHWISARGSEAVVDAANSDLYLAPAVRNAGAGIAVLQGWYLWTELVQSDVGHRAPEEFRRQVRDIYIAPGDIGLWQAALHQADGELASELLAARSERRPFAVDLLYSDQVGAPLAGERRAPLEPGSDGTPVTLGRDAGHSFVDEADDHRALADRGRAALH
jgi:hypothetical protein